MKDRLWLTESLGGESDAMSKKNLMGDRRVDTRGQVVTRGQGDMQQVSGSYLLAESKLLFTKSLKGLICSSLVNRTWFAML